MLKKYDEILKSIAKYWFICYTPLVEIDGVRTCTMRSHVFEYKITLTKNKFKITSKIIEKLYLIKKLPQNLNAEGEYEGIDDLKNQINSYFAYMEEYDVFLLSWEKRDVMFRYNSEHSCKGFELILDENLTCLCGEGYIHYELFENEDLRQISKAVLHCDKCAKKYHIESAHKEHPYMDESYYMVPLGKSIHEKNGEEVLKASIKITLPEW